METESLDRELVVFEGPSDPIVPREPHEEEFFKRLREQYVKDGLIPDSPQPPAKDEQSR